MDVLKTTSEFLSTRKYFSESLGFVPTMGALHEGHLALVQQSKAENKKTACSIFVNPIQFNNHEDFAKYPNTLAKDLDLLEKVGCDLVFVPTVSDMYPTPPWVKFDFGSLERVMEGAFRPGHFNGVATVVSKLFHIVQPTVAYFGRKDLQQTLVIKQLIDTLGFPLELRICDTLRESDGLAMSSRNTRLTAEQRQLAPVLYQTLLHVKEKIERGMSPKAAQQEAWTTLSNMNGIRPEYVEIADAATLLPIDDSFKGELAVCIAAFLGDVRLIDNLVFEKM